MNTIF